jgi:hypothetical protein
MRGGVTLRVTKGRLSDGATKRKNQKNPDFYESDDLKRRVRGGHRGRLNSGGRNSSLNCGGFTTENTK